MKITEINRENVRYLREEITCALQEISEKTGVQFSIGTITFTSDGFSAPLKASVDVGDGLSIKDRERANDWEKYAHMYGIIKKIGDTFNVNGEDYVITGWAKRAKKYPVIARRVSDGKSFKFPSYTIQEK